MVKQESRVILVYGVNVAKEGADTEDKVEPNVRQQPILSSAVKWT